MAASGNEAAISKPKKGALLGSVFSGLGNQWASAAITGVGQLAVTATLARLLTPVDYGLFGLAAVYVGLATVETCPTCGGLGAA